MAVSNTRLLKRSQLKRIGELADSIGAHLGAIGDALDDYEAADEADPADRADERDAARERVQEAIGELLAEAEKLRPYRSAIPDGESEDIPA